MPPTVTNEIIIEEPFQIHQLFKQLSEEAIDLRITEKFLAEVERRMLKVSMSAFNIDIIKAALQKLRDLPKDGSPMDFWQVDFQIKQEFQTWRNILEKRDSKIETYHLRRFCDTTQEPLDNVVYSALARFYRSLEHSSANQSKFDLAITRLFASDRGQAYRTLRLNRSELTEHLHQLFDNWDGKKNYPLEIPKETAKTIEKIDEFIDEAGTLVSFDELVKCNLFERFRIFKQSLGQNFYHPAVVSAAVDCNLAVGNTFHALLGNANENLHTRVKATFDFAGAFHDTSPNAQIHISEILNEVKIHETLDPKSPENQELRYLWDLLEHIGVEPEVSSQPDQTQNLLDSDLSKKSLPPQDRIKSLLAVLGEPEPNIKLLRDYMQKYESLRVLDLNDFLHFSDENADQLCRKALSLILWAEEIRENELNQPKNLPVTIRDEVKTVLRKSQTLADHLQLLIEVSDTPTQNRLLVVSNKLLEFRLKLERAIVRFSNRNLGISKSETPNEEKKEVPSVSKVEKVESAVVYTQTKSWVFALLLLGVLVSGLTYYLTKQLGDIVPAVQEVEKIDTKALPKGELMRVAYRKKNALFITVQDEWTKLSKAEQKETLENLLNYPAKTKLEVVVITNGAGKPVGQISAEGVNTSDNFQIVENAVLK